MSAIDGQQSVALEQAALWYTRLQDETAAPTEHLAWQQWLQAAPVNQWAWQQLEHLQSRLRGMPGSLAGRTLDLAGQAQQQTRRKVLKGFTLLLGANVIGWAGYQQASRGPWLADYRSAVGEQLPVALSDGGRLLLNTDSAVDVRYEVDRRLVYLRRGEVMITTGKDAQQRPFLVQTPQGLIEALGTQFSVRLEGERSEVCVYQHGVRITPARGRSGMLDAGQCSSFSDLEMAPVAVLQPSRGAWSNRQLIANDQRLDTFIAELARYRPGWLRCDPAVAGLRISGTFALDDTDQALRAVASALPVTVERRTRYWVTVAAR